MKTNVTETSIQAYHSHTGKQRQIEEFARFVLTRTKEGKRTWDRLVYREIGMLPNTVSARRNDINDMGIIEIDGINYRIEYTGKSRDPITRQNVNTYALVLAGDAKQLELFG